MRHTNRWTLPGVTFFQVEDHGFPDFEGRPMYAYALDQRDSNGGNHGYAMDHHGMPKVGEYFTSLDRAVIAWVGEKYTGPRGAGGSGVGTAADWFARMIGMESFTPISVSDQRKVMGEAIAATRRQDGPIYQRAGAMVDELARRGLVISTMNDGS